MKKPSIDPRDPGTGSPLTTTEWILLILGVALITSLPWTVDYWPTQDGPNHIATAHILAHYHDAGTPFARYMMLKPVTTESGYSLNPSNFQYVLLLFFNNFVSLPVAMKILASLTMAALPFSLVLLLLRTVPERTRNIFWLLPLFTGWALGMGFIRYLLACIFGFLMLALASGVRGGRRMQRWKPTWIHLVLASAAFFLCTWSHPFIAVLFGIVLMVFEAAALRRGKGWDRLAAIAAPGAFLVILCMLLGTSPASSFASATQWWGPADMLWGLVGYHVGFSHWEYFPRGATLLVLYLAAFRGCRRILRQGPSFQRSVCHAVILLHILYLALPAVLSGWYFCSARSLIIGAYLLPLVAVFPERRKIRLCVAPAALLLTVIVSFIQYQSAVRFSSEIAAIVDIGKFVPRGSRVLPICGYNTGLPNPLHHAWAYLVPDRDIVTPYHSAAGKPDTGGGRFRALSYRPGVLNEKGALPWINEGEVRGACSGSTERCRETLNRLEPVFQKYDRILMVRPSVSLLTTAQDKLILERKEGDVYLFSAGRQLAGERMPRL